MPKPIKSFADDGIRTTENGKAIRGNEYYIRMGECVEPPTPVKMSVITPEPSDNFVRNEGHKPLTAIPRNRKPKRKVGSSLSRQRINNVPSVYHRPLQGSGVYHGRYLDNKGSYRRPKSINHDEEAPKTFEDPNKNSLDDFEPRFSMLETSRFIAKNLVRAHNHPGRKNASALDKASEAYKTMMDDCNICWSCHSPIKVQRAAISKPKEMLYDKRRKTRRGANIGNHFETAKPHPNVMFADVVTHFEVFTRNDGTLGYHLVSEPHVSGRKLRAIFVRRTPKTITRRKWNVFTKRIEPVEVTVFDETYVEQFADGSEKVVTVPSSYRVRNQQCQCMWRRKQAKMIVVRPK